MGKQASQVANPEQQTDTGLQYCSECGHTNDNHDKRRVQGLQTGLTPDIGKSCIHRSIEKGSKREQG